LNTIFIRMVWHQHKRDINYKMRKNLTRKITQYAHKHFEINSPIPLKPQITFTHAGGKKNIVAIERYRYMSRFKREFTVIRVHLSDNSTLYLNKLRLVHLIPLSQFVLK
jgi:hypothetical protein